MRDDIIREINYFRERGMKPNYSELARVNKADRRTIRKYCDNPSVARKKREYHSSIEEFDEIIQDKIGIPGITYRSIYSFLVNEKGLKKKYPTFTEYCRKRSYRPGKTAGVHLRYETAPGKQLQVDWKENMKLQTRDGGEMEFNVFSATLGYSRKHFFMYSEGKAEQDFIRCMNQTLVSLGGSIEEILTDNMSAIVSISNIDGSNVRRKHQNISAWEKDSGIRIRLCKPRSPETKGKVESSNRFVNRLAAYNGEVMTADDIRKAIARIQNDVNDETNDEIGMPPEALFGAKEKQALGKLPNMSLLDSYTDGGMAQTVQSSLLVPFHGRQYSVPAKYIGKKVRVVRNANTVEIYYSKEMIASHRYDEGKKTNYREEDYIDGLRSALPHSNDDDLEQKAKENLRRFR